jgi:hypothetical protein
MWLKLFEGQNGATQTELISFCADATANISIWSNVEAGLGITAGSLVTVRPFFRWCRNPHLEYHKNQRGSVPPNMRAVLSTSSSTPPNRRLDMQANDLSIEV